MADETTTSTAATAAGDDQASSTGTTEAAGTAPNADARKTFTQDDVSRIAEESRKRGEAKAAKQLAELQEKIDAHNAEKQAAERAKLDAVELAQLEAKEARDTADRFRAEADQARIEAMRFGIVATEGGALPADYRRCVTGSTPDEVRASLAETTERFRADRTAIVSAVAAMSADQLVAEFGEELGGTLGARLFGKTPPLGHVGMTSGSPGQNAAQPFGEQNTTLEAWRAERARRGYPSR